MAADQAVGLCNILLQKLHNAIDRPYEKMVLSAKFWRLGQRPVRGKATAQTRTASYLSCSGFVLHT